MIFKTRGLIKKIYHMIKNDLIADMIVRVKNAAATRKESVIFPHSKLAVAVVGALERTGYLESLPKKGKKILRQLEAKVVYVGAVAKFKGAHRISKPSKRVYWKIKDVTPVKSGHGSLILSTPKGILTDKEARKENVGGEALFQIW
ncbi:MAG: 30S ribosomal protein S8 [Parcubacteria group bacterium GW2011_GWA2_47_16]|nr:MAG: 30S ribosomal protein S8 [Parcubacteria group bacterium GW2011_GWA2_47_16]